MKALLQIIVPLLASIVPGYGATVAANVDFGSSGIPGPMFAAAGRAGLWSEVAHFNTVASNPVKDVTGLATTITFSGSAGFSSVTPSSQPFKGDDAKLLGDYLVSGLNNYTLTIHGLPNVPMDFIFYTIGRQDFARATTIAPFGNALLAKTATGVWGGKYVEGVTHLKFQLTPVAGKVNVAIFSPADAFLSGVQIATVPEPGSAALVAVAAVCLLSHRRRAA